MRHLKRYEELEGGPSTRVGTIKVRHPLFQKEDNVPYPREDAEDRSYEEAEALRAEAAKQLQSMERKEILKLLAPDKDVETYEDILMKELMAERRTMLKGAH